MSNHDKIAKLKEIIRHLVVQELRKDDIEEASTTASAGAANPMGTGIHYDTPKAFSSGSAVGHKSPEVGGYKKLKEDKDIGHQDDEPDMLKSTALEIQEYGKKLYDALDKYDEMEDEVDFPNWWQSKLIVAKDYLQKAYHYLDSEEKKDGVQESINESQPFADFPQFPKLSRDQQESLDELFGFAESYQIFNAFNNNPKKFIQTLDDMAKIRKTSNKQPKGVSFNKGKKEFVKEVKQQEIDALNKFVKSFKKLRDEYWKIGKMGDKTLNDKKYNDYYESILTAEKEMETLVKVLKTKQMIGEGRYHDWRNDESLTPKQKIGQSVKEIRDSLNELDKRIKMNLKLKTELNVDSRDYWRNTHKALTKISERLVKMANKVGNLK